MTTLDVDRRGRVGIVVLHPPTAFPRWTCGLVLSVLLCATPAPAAQTTPAPAAQVAPAHVLVSVSLSVARGSDGSGERQTSTVSVRASLSISEVLSVVAGLRATPRGSSAYRDALAEVLAIGGTLSRTDVDRFLEQVSGRLDRASSLQIDAGVATVKVTADGVAPWRTTSGGPLTLQPGTVAADAQLNVALRVDDSRVATARPVPSARSSDHEVAWTFAPGQTPAVDVTVAPPLSDGRDGLIIRPAVAALVVFGLPFLALLILAPRRARDTERPLEEDDLPERARRRLSAAGVALGVAGAVSFELVDRDVVGVRHLLASVFGTQEVGIAAIALLGLLPFVALAGQQPHHRRWLLIVGVGGALLVLLAQGLRVSPTGPSSDRVWAYALACCVLAAALIAAIVGALARWLASVAPEVAAASRRLIGRRSRRAIIVVIALAAIVQLYAASTLHRTSGGSASALLRTLADVPILLVNFAPIPLATILGVGLALSLNRRAAPGAEPDFTLRDTRVTLTLLFSMIVVRRGGYRPRLPFPLGFLHRIAGFDMRAAPAGEEPSREDHP
jgi:hypothetical protein